MDNKNCDNISIGKVRQSPKKKDYTFFIGNTEYKSQSVEEMGKKLEEYFRRRKKQRLNNK